MVLPVQAYWWRSSLMRVQVRPASSERKMPRTPRILELVYTAGYVAPGAALPNPTTSPWSTASNLVKEVPESVDRHSPYGVGVAGLVVPPASQMSPSWPGTGLNRTFPAVGRPVAAV